VFVNGGRGPAPNWFMDLRDRVSALTTPAAGPTAAADQRWIAAPLRSRWPV